VDIEVEDDLVPANAGRWILRVSRGRGRLTRGGGGAVRLDAATLAPVFTGYASPLELRSHGQIEGRERDLRALGAAFAGPAPWIREMF